MLPRLFSHPILAPGPRFFGEFEKLDDLFGGFLNLRDGSQPPMNVWSDDDGYTVEVELPGLAPDEIQISVVGDKLSIRAEHGSAVPDETVHRRERRRGAFERVLSLGEKIDPEGIEARLEDGILTVRLPKAAEARARRIEVKSTGNRRVEAK